MKTIYPKDPITNYNIWLIYINNQVYKNKTT